MREILFRAKRKDNGELVEGYLAPASDGVYICRFDCFDERYGVNYGKYRLLHDAYEVDPATVGQYINRTDNRQQKIFVGDRVLVNYGRHYNEPKGLTRIGTIAYDEKDGAFAVAIDNSAVKVKFWDIARIEVIHDEVTL